MSNIPRYNALEALSRACSARESPAGVVQGLEVESHRSLYLKENKVPILGWQMSKSTVIDRVLELVRLLHEWSIDFASVDGVIPVEAPKVSIGIMLGFRFLATIDVVPHFMRKF